MEPIVALDRSVVAVRIEDVVHLMVALQAPPAPVADRAPLDVAVVLDRSGSMGGAPLDAVTRATADLLRLAGPEDRFAVVAFDSDVDLVLPLAAHDPDAAAARVLALRPGGSTNLSGGWLKGLEVLNDARPEAVSRIVLLTDGQANCGITDLALLGQLASNAKSRGLTTSCIGFGDHYDEAFLAGLADAGAGNDYWCAGPDQAAAVFTAELGGLASVVAQNVSVEIRPVDEVVADMGVLNDFPLTPVPGGVQVALGDAYGGERRRVVAAFRLQPREHEGSVHLADVVIRWVSVVGAPAMHTVTMPVTVEFGADPDAVPRNPEVSEQVLLLTAAKQREEARGLADAGRTRDAAAALRSAASLLGDVPAAAPMVAEILADADRLDRDDWDLAASKRHHAQSRSVNKGRRSDFGDDDPGRPSPRP